uniref:Isochorismatase-like domain-containing protein n=1 Tax=Zea mays TaxID=4577 RepID=A0A804PGI4_MAIZE
MPSHLALLSCLLVLLLSFDKFLFHYLKRRWFSGGSGATVPRPPAKSRRNMAAAKWSETAMLVIDMQKDFVDPAMRSPMLVAGGEAVVPAVAGAVAVARERGIFVVWVNYSVFSCYNFCAVFFCLARHQYLVYWFDATRRADFSVQRERDLLMRAF